MKELDTEECHGNIEANSSISYWRIEKKEPTQSEVYPQACYFIYIFDLVLKKENKQMNKQNPKLPTNQKGRENNQNELFKNFLFFFWFYNSLLQIIFGDVYLTLRLWCFSIPSFFYPIYPLFPLQ